MIEIKYTTRVFPQKNGAVAIRVRWNHNKGHMNTASTIIAASER